MIAIALTALFVIGYGAYRFGGTEAETFYLEPFGLIGLLDPDIDVIDDLALEALVGINVGAWGRARLTLQGEMNRVRRNFPAGYFLGRSPDHLAVLLQAGVAF